MSQPSLKQDLTLFAAITIVVGNMIGSGVFGLPAALASVATPSIILLAWTIAGLGACLIALSYGNLSQKFPDAGGPVLYSYSAMGPFTGYIVCLMWWMAATIGNAAIVDLIFTQIVRLFPHLDTPAIKIVATLALIWAFTYTNIRGVKLTGWISIVTTTLKIGVFIIIILLALPHLKLDLLFNITPFAEQIKAEHTPFQMFAAAIALIFWAFAGLESSTLTGGEIKNPEKNIRKSIVYGLVFVSIFYIIINFSLMALIPQEQLSMSKSPFADAINMVTGTDSGGVIIDIAILISVVGALSGWLLTTGRSVYAAGKDKMFLPIFAKVGERYRTPYVALVVSSVITSFFLFIDFYSTITGNKGGISPFINITTVASLLSLPTYAITVIAEIILMRRGQIKHSKSAYTRAIVASIFSMVFIWLGFTGSTVPLIYWILTFIFFVIGMALYPYFRKITMNKV